MANLPHLLATAVLASSLSLAGYAAPIAVEAGWPADESVALTLPSLTHRVEADVTVPGQGYFSEAYSLAPERMVSVAAETVAGTEPAVLPKQETRREALTTSGDTFVLTALSSRLAATPEPASLALLGTGALSAVAMLRRRVR